MPSASRQKCTVAWPTSASNRVNLRREFFYATAAEVRDLLAEVAGDLLEYTDSAEASEYHQSMNEAANHAPTQNRAV